MGLILFVLLFISPYVIISGCLSRDSSKILKVFVICFLNGKFGRLKSFLILVSKVFQSFIDVGTFLILYL